MPTIPFKSSNLWLWGGHPRGRHGSTNPIADFELKTDTRMLKTDTRIMNLSVSLCFRSSHKSMPQIFANFAIGTREH
jgi:hypothetical protein